jgi:hypothetical protein
MTLQHRLDLFYESRYYWPAMAVVAGTGLIILVGIMFC